MNYIKKTLLEKTINRLYNNENCYGPILLTINIWIFYPGSNKIL